MSLDRDFWMAVRHALLILIGAIEKALGIIPTTKDCRQMAKRTERSADDNSIFNASPDGR